MSGEQASSEPTPQPEMWVFGGSRVGKTGKRVHCWIDPAGRDLRFKASGRFTVGSVYEAQVAREGDLA